MIENADKLGMDLGDLKEYGFDVKSMKCGGKTCLNKDRMKQFDDILNKKNRLNAKIIEEGANLYRRASCHPKMQKHVNPIVKSIFSTYPFAYITWPLGVIIDPLLWILPCTCPIEFVYFVFI